jgi:hypothetical protein
VGKSIEGHRELAKENCGREGKRTTSASLRFDAALSCGTTSSFSAPSETFKSRVFDEICGLPKALEAAAKNAILSS